MKTTASDKLSCTLGAELCKMRKIRVRLCRSGVAVTLVKHLRNSSDYHIFNKNGLNPKKSQQLIPKMTSAEVYQTSPQVYQIFSTHLYWQQSSMSFGCSHIWTTEFIGSNSLLHERTRNYTIMPESTTAKTYLNCFVPSLIAIFESEIDKFVRIWHGYYI